MTTGKRALIVDDSRSARVILSRMLEQHGLAVDTAESAEQALEYLHQQRPDVIFMDHLMPGMDGFQAVQVIKADPQTATIPLMMYTSQEGEVYVSQARALGAVGVLPKTVRPVDVSRVLYQLHLLPDRRQLRSALFGERAAAAKAAAAAAAEAQSEAAEAEGGAPVERSTPTASSAPVGAPAEVAMTATGTWALPAAAISELQGGLRQSMQQLVRDQLAEQRRFMLATFEAFARRMSSELKEAIAKVPPPPAAEPIVPPPPPAPWWPVLLTALFAALPAVILGVLYWQALNSQAGLSRELATARADAAAAVKLAQSAARAAPTIGPVVTTGQAVPLSGPPARPPTGPVAVEYVPYGETPLANARLERLRGLAATLEAQRFRGRIVVETFIGDFCLSGNAGDGFQVADDSLPTQKCDLVGNPVEDSLSPAQRQSVAFANFAATLGQRTGGAITVEIVSAGRRNPVEYPEQGENSTAGEWNGVATQNNRVEFRLVPAG
jgi:CheY-like chemotaxis protein